MYFNESKPKPTGVHTDPGKLRRKLAKCLAQLKRHDPDVVVSEQPTKILFVANSSVLCNVSVEELEGIFTQYDEKCEFVVYPSKRTYSFVIFSSTESASRASSELNGFVHPDLKTSHQPFVIAFAEDVPRQSSSGQSAPNDFEIIHDFITADEEKELVDALYANPKLARMKYRSVVHFEHEFDYSTNAAFRSTDPAPPLIANLVERIMKTGKVKFRPDQITANIYEPGQGIPSHYDTHSAFEDPVVSLSMLSDVVMEFKDGANSARISPVTLPKRSLCFIQGESRYRWKHGIVNRKYDVDPATNRVVPRQLRVSITFRKIRHEPCQCQFKEFCDWDRGGEMGVPHSETSARSLEQSYVSNVYEKIATHFDETRHSTWRGVKRFLDSLPQGCLLYDVGCGNGKYLTPKDGLIKLGCDMCMGLCRISAEKGAHVVRADALSIPFREAADAVISIAVLHHFSSFERRRQAIEEMLRVLRPGGRVCITVWSMDQSNSEYAKMRDNKDQTRAEIDLVVRETGRLKVHDGKDFEQQDLLVPWSFQNPDEPTYLRFYHVFRENEMEELVASIAGCELESNEMEQGNYIAVIRKN